MGGKLWRRVPDETGKARLTEIDPASVSIDRPTVVYVSGFLTTNKAYGFISGGIKKTQELLDNADLQDLNPDIITWSHSSLANVFNLGVYDTFPNTYSSSAGYKLAETFIMPLVAEDFKRNKDGSVEGKPRDAEDAAKRLRNLTLFGYSAGSVVSQEMFNASLKMMKGVGYEEKDARKLLKEVVLMTAGTVSRCSKETDRFTTVTMVATNDRLNRLKNMMWGTVGTIRRAWTTKYSQDKHTKPLNIRPYSPSYVFLTAAARKHLYKSELEQDGQKQRIIPRPLYPAWSLRRSYHEIPHYVTRDPEHSDFANIALHTLANAVRRTETPDPLKLIRADLENPVVSGDHESYNARLDSALQPTPTSLLKRLPIAFD